MESRHNKDSTAVYGMCSQLHQVDKPIKTFIYNVWLVYGFFPLPCERATQRNFHLALHA